MKIVFVLPEIGVCGGVKAVFEFANCLQKKGHKVSIIYPFLFLYPSGKGYSFASKDLIKRLRGFLGRLYHNFLPMWFDLKTKPVRVPLLDEMFIPDADVVVATSWPTAYYVKKYSSSKGEKFYLVQHYEIWDGPENLVNNSYKLGLKIIVNSTWLKNTLEKRLDVKAESLILHSPDLDQFYPDANFKNKQRNHLRILMCYRVEEWKGTDDGILAFKIAREKCPNVSLVMFGLGKGKNVPDWVEFHKNPPQEKLREIYNSCDIFLFSSWHEGFGMPPMEAMACKCAVVTTEVGAVPDYAIPNKTAIVCPPRSPQLLAEGLVKLIENRQLLNEIAEAGHKHVIENFGWEKASNELEKTFKRFLINITDRA